MSRPIHAGDVLTIMGDKGQVRWKAVKSKKSYLDKTVTRNWFFREVGGRGRDTAPSFITAVLRRESDGAEFRLPQDAPTRI